LGGSEVWADALGGGTRVAGKLVGWGDLARGEHDDIDKRLDRASVWPKHVVGQPQTLVCRPT